MENKIKERMNAEFKEKISEYSKKIEWLRQEQTNKLDRLTTRYSIKSAWNWTTQDFVEEIKKLNEELQNIEVQIKVLEVEIKTLQDLMN